MRRHYTRQDTRFVITLTINIRDLEAHMEISTVPVQYVNCVVRNDQDLERFLTQASVQLMSSPDATRSLVTRVRTMIRDDVSGQFPEFENIAESFHLTTATLRRRLRAEGSSYQQIKDDLRRDTAIYHLSRGTLTMERIAESVGFSEPTSFFRAFKRWTGVTPRAYISNQDE